MNRCRLSVFSLGFFVSAAALGASLNFSGNFRTEGFLMNGGNLGIGGTTAATKAYLLGRALLQPKLVIDDHFSLNSQWSLLGSPNFTPANTAAAFSAGQGGYIFGDPSTANLVLSRAWLEWISDFGVVRLGRMPVSWGYGLIWDAGTGVWDDFQTTLDRLEYRLHFGHVIGALAYSKPRKDSVLSNDDDADFYTIYVRYDNPEQDVEAGLLYERQVRSGGQQAALKSTSNPYFIPDANSRLGGTRPPLATNAPHPLSNNVLDFYARKSLGYLSFGGEVGWIWGSAVDFDGDTVEDQLSAVAVMLNVSYEYHKVKAFLDFLYASGDATLNDTLNGFVLLHRNRRVGMILGRELLGSYYNNTASQGSMVYYGTGFSGVYYIRPGIRVDWSPAWASGLEIIIAQKAATAGGEAGNLGVEVDFGTDHELYKNFDLGLSLGYLFSGQGLVTTGAPSGVFGIRATASVKF